MSTHVPSQRELLRAIKKQGWTVSYGGKHKRAVSPDGRHTVIIAVSPSDTNDILHTRARLRRAGAKV